MAVPSTKLINRNLRGDPQAHFKKVDTVFSHFYFHLTLVYNRVSPIYSKSA